MANEELKQKIKGQIIEYLNLMEVTPEDIKDDSPLFGPDGDLDLDSIDSIELTVLLEREYGIKICESGVKSTNIASKSTNMASTSANMASKSAKMASKSAKMASKSANTVDGRNFASKIYRYHIGKKYRVCTRIIEESYRNHINIYEIHIKIYRNHI